MDEPYAEITACRICGRGDLLPILSLGRQALTGVFPKDKGQPVPAGPVDLVKCDESGRGGGCGLVQLKQSYRKEQMYGKDYGYNSGLNPSMVRHLQDKVRKLLSWITLEPGDLVVDIGSNDGTLLKAYPPEASLVGVDPIAEKFRSSYPKGSQLIVDFFSAGLLRRHFGGRKAKVITSIAMFYDLEAPLEFCREAGDSLADDGVWVLEQSYLPTMIEMNAYDTICHEHLEYYRVKQIKWMTDKLGLKIVGLEANNVNGGSVSIAVAKKDAPYPECSALLNDLLRAEEPYASEAPYRAFRDSVLGHRDELRRWLERSAAEGRRVLGYGASTKGNVILQFCGITPRELPMIGEVNREKFGCFTPGTLIPIVSEEEIKAGKPDYLLVLPWHFRDFILQKEQAFLRSGGKLFFPLPRPETCDTSSPLG